MDGIKLEAETVSGQFEGGDPHLGEEVVQLLGYLWGRRIFPERFESAKITTFTKILPLEKYPLYGINLLYCTHKPP